MACKSAVIFGDSRTADNTFVAPPPASVNRWTNVSWFAYTNALLGWPFELLNNAGVGGNKTSDMLGRVQSDVIAYAPSVCVVFGGTNDLTGPASQDARNIEVSGTFAHLTTIYRQLIAAGIYVFAFSESPDSAGGFNKQLEKMQLNELLREWWRGRSDGEYVDIYSVLVDPATAAPLPSMTRDGLHFSVLGGYVVGKQLAAALARFSGNKLPLVASSKDQYATDSLLTNICQNSLMTGTEGTVSGGASGAIPDHWAAAGPATSVCSIVPRADGIGSDIQAVISGVAGQYTTLSIAMQQAYVQPGSSYVCEGEFAVLNPVNVQDCSLYCGFSNGQSQNFGTFSTYTTSGYLPESATFRVRSPKLVMPDGPYVGASLTLLLNLNGTGGATVKLGRVGARSV